MQVDGKQARSWGDVEIGAGTNGTQLSQVATNNLSTENSLKIINKKNEKMRPRSPGKTKGCSHMNREEAEWMANRPLMGGKGAGSASGRKNELIPDLNSTY